MVGIEKELTIVEAWNEIRKLDNKISLLETLRETKGCKSPKTVELKKLIVEGGRISNNALLNAISIVDEYTEELQSLYTAKNAYEKYILEEIDRMKISSPGIVIGFLKEQMGMTWLEIERQTHFSDKQNRRYYDEYKGKTPKNNTFLKDDQF